MIYEVLGLGEKGRRQCVTDKRAGGCVSCMGRVLARELSPERSRLVDYAYERIWC